MIEEKKMTGSFFQEAHEGCAYIKGLLCVDISGEDEECFVFLANGNGILSG